MLAYNFDLRPTIKEIRESEWMMKQKEAITQQEVE